MKIQPKPYILNHKLRRQSQGVERRMNMYRYILEDGTPLPKSIEFKDIDMAFNEWVKSLNITFDGNKLPIFQLFSNQRIGEYAQSWKHLDSVGNLIMNFFSVTRDNNPKQGDGQGGYFNIPGNRQYPMFITKGIDENGDEKYQMYTMHQPYSVNFQYTLLLVCDKYELLNQVNQTILDAFKSLQCYIRPNGHYMPLILDEINDESEYAIDDRKYYSQSYKFTLQGYIIRKEDYDVVDIPHKFVLNLFGNDMQTEKDVEIRIKDDCQCCDETSSYEDQRVTINIEFPICKWHTQFTMDEIVHIDEVELDNIDDFKITINSDAVDFNDEVTILDGDVVYVEIERKKTTRPSTLILHGYTDNVVDTRATENELDMPILDEEIIVNADETE